MRIERLYTDPVCQDKKDELLREFLSVKFVKDATHDLSEKKHELFFASMAHVLSEQSSLCFVKGK
jgi:hypothetical protein